MKEILDDFMTEEEGASEFPYDPNVVNSGNYWWKILTNPTDAFGFILSEKLLSSTLVLYLLTLTTSFFEPSQLDEVFPSLAFFYKNEVTRIIFELCLVSFIVVGFIAMLYYIGKILGGTGSFLEVGMTYVWSSVPSLISLPLALYLLFSTTQYQDSENFMLIESYQEKQALLGYVNTLLSIWGLILSFKGLAIAHQFSTRKSVYTYLIIFGFMIGIGIFLAMYLELFLV